MPTCRIICDVKEMKKIYLANFGGIAENVQNYFKMASNMQKNT